MHTAMVKIPLFAIGTVFGSFLNVCIYRVPRGKSIVFPGSHCTSCGHPIPFYDNIPIVSYLLLKGRCRFCKSKISVKYPIVELLTGGVFLATFVRFGWSVELISACVLFSLLIIVAFIDFDTETVPDKITIPGIAIGLVLSTLTISILKGLLGAAIGFISLYSMASIGRLAFKREVMGGGDIKLLTMIGAFVGPVSVLLVLFVGSFFGVIGGAVSRRGKLPFAPFLSIATFLVTLYGDKLLCAFGY